MKVWIFLKEHVNESLYACNRILKESKNDNIQVKFVAISDFDILKVQRASKNNKILINHTMTDLPDIIIPRTGNTQALYIMQYLCYQGVKILNSPDSIQNADDKFITLQILYQNRIAIPKTTFLRNFDYINKMSENDFPLVLKKTVGFQGKSTWLCNSKEELIRQVQTLVSTGNHNLIIQELMGLSFGKDIRVLVIGEKVIGSMLRIAQNGQFQANYALGAKVEAINISEGLQKTALKAVRLLNLDMAGVDFLFDKDNKYKICEVNPYPGFEGFEKATGINVAQEILKFIQKRVEVVNLSK
ncbi:MAG: alpha-L-glutamate ligase, RimK family, ribosomal protein S6 modification protein [Candidatus Peregrinibacteria bacterium GW2011_GWF2_33_10]|nr:MAG: alpha-L-glutamate ligase, RimK family, ribosomal protein S6 modification protein [Candidatus Peregrinibacteria bacterium GW2011_GWF2_33_10]OGJ43992.1 MAG: hypothetical protein A2272_05160 [Candidatus Peregrinibacteria bacterium RIFOXYA12_FULL_33_12]OGJ45510.1 MAG: hypothetical protein A2263_05925 [Candidatus Peregrinibacteria bacterium RIFOXYA2_FULL_33_21]OGJ50015.1 MAG: hypothetical protein A2307_04575 [Candidatus Peregrinibacteria bacterium RIFOXYB2_FULL_33_20]